MRCLSDRGWTFDSSVDGRDGVFVLGRRLSRGVWEAVESGRDSSFRKSSRGQTRRTHSKGSAEGVPVGVELAGAGGETGTP
jgi:hypothetical protein